MSLVDHGHELIQLLSPPAMLINTGIKNEPLFAQKPHGLDKLLRQARCRRLVLQQVAETLDLGPGSRPGHLLSLLQILLDLGGAEVHGGPGDDAQAQVGILWGVALAVPRLAVDDAGQPLDLHQWELPVPAFIVEPVCLEKDEALQVGGGAGRVAVLGQRVALAERVVGRVPLEGFQLGLWVEMNVGVHDGKCWCLCQAKRLEIRLFLAIEVRLKLSILKDDGFLLTWDDP
ncbi:hypothetical protein PoMZ_01998 [Pyricularia oryzae]|uniref:Uncharacterized protein n=1 Tax=Pyricularia oryzae TaxID=318829 RepID=A0A4P7N3M3_PYROR|nr:hypothetical protein PoMZ_01998 [Pyricularia oryzae]